MRRFIEWFKKLSQPKAEKHEGNEMTCPHSINLEDSCGICDAQTIMELKAKIKELEDKLAIGHLEGGIG